MLQWYMCTIQKFESKVEISISLHQFIQYITVHFKFWIHSISLTEDLSAALKLCAFTALLNIQDICSRQVEAAFGNLIHYGSYNSSY
jgi:hypothetical protein